MSLNKSRTRKAIIGTAGAAIAGLAIFGVGSTGADFTASDTGTVNINSGNLSIDLSDDTSTGTFDLTYANLAPGDNKVDKFTVKNTGSIPAAVKVAGVNVGGNNLNGLTGPQINLLKVSVDDRLAATPVTSVPSNIALGSLNPGQSRTYTVRVGLDQSAGNEWMNRSVGATVTVALVQ